MKLLAPNLQLLKGTSLSTSILFLLLGGLISFTSVGTKAQTHPSFELRRQKMQELGSLKNTQFSSISPSSYGTAYATNQYYEYIGSFDFSVDERNAKVDIRLNVVITTGEENEYGSGEFVNVWIDWEGDGKFDEGDQVVEQMQFAKAVGFKGVLYYSASVAYPEDIEIADETWIRASLGYGYDPAPSDSWTYGSSITKPIKLGDSEFSDLKIYITGPEATMLKAASSQGNYPKQFGKGSRVDPYYGVNTHYSLTSTLLQINNFDPSYYQPNKEWKNITIWDTKKFNYLFKGQWPGTTLNGKVELWQDNTLGDVKIGDIGQINWKKTGKSTTVLVKGQLEGSVIKTLDQGSYEFRFKRIPTLHEQVLNVLPGRELLTPEKTLEMDFNFTIDRLPYYIQSPSEVKTSGDIEMQSCVWKDWYATGWSGLGAIAGAAAGSYISAKIAALPAATTLGATAASSPIFVGIGASLVGGAIAWISFKAVEWVLGTPFGWEVGDFAWYYDWKAKKYVWNGTDYVHEFDIDWHRGNWYRKGNLMGYGYWSEGPGWIHQIDRSISREHMWGQHKLNPLDWPPKHFRNYPYEGYGKNSSPTFVDPDPLVVNLLPVIYPYTPQQKFKIEKKDQYIEITVVAQDPELEYKHLTFLWQNAAGQIIDQSEDYLKNARTSTIQWMHPGDGLKHRITVRVSDNLGATSEATMFIGPDGLKGTDHSEIAYTEKGIAEGGFLSDVSDETIDSDNNGLQDTLIIQFKVNLADLDPEFDNGAYLISASLLDMNDDIISSSSYLMNQSIGYETIKLPFLGRNISKHGIDGPFDLSLVTVDRLSASGLSFVAYDGTDYPTTSYSADEFESIYLRIAGAPTDAGVDANGDALYDWLRVDMDLQFDKIGAYSVQGSLYDRDTNFVSFGVSDHSIASEGIHTIYLQFDGASIRNSLTDGPYLLSNLVVFDQEDQDVFVMGDDFMTNDYRSTDFQTEYAMFSGVYAERTPDANQDGLFDSLIISTEVTVSEGGLYYINGALTGNDTSIIEEFNGPVNLQSGNNTIDLSFTGLSIWQKGLDGPYGFTGLSIHKENERWIFSPDLYLTSAYNSASFQKPPLLLQENFSESTEDQDLNGKSDILMISGDLETVTSGQYEIYGELVSVSGNAVLTASLSAEYMAGNQPFDLIFYGEDIVLQNDKGPYLLSLYAWDLQNNLVFYSKDAYTTSTLNLEQFESLDAIITETYIESTEDLDENGLFDLLKIGIEISVSEPGTYLLKAECLDTSLHIIDEAEVFQIAEAGVQAFILEFEGKKFFSNGVDGPYVLGNLFLYRIEDDSWKNLDIIDFAYGTEAYQAIEFQHSDAYLANEYHDYGWDQDENGLYDVLVVDVGLHVEQSGTYRIEGQLYDDMGYFIQTASFQQYLYEGHDTISLEFIGGRIRGHGDTSPYHLKYTRIFNNYNQLLQSVNEAYTTKTYNWEEFEISAADLTLFTTELTLMEGEPDDGIVTIFTKVFNFGGTPVDSVQVNFYNWDLGLDELKTVYNISGSSPGLVGIDVTFPEESFTYSISVTIDPYDSIPEMDEYNNNSYIDLEVPLPDFPDPPQELRGFSNSESVVLNWNPVSGSISGFNVYRREEGDSTYTRMNNELISELNYTDTTVVSDKIYYYALTSYLVSAPSLESAYSTEIKTETVETILELLVSEYTALAQDVFVLPLKIRDLKGTFINSVNLKIGVNPDVLECLEASTNGTIAEEWTEFNYNCMASGELQIEMSGIVPLSDTGTLVEIRFLVHGEPGDTSSIRIIECMLNDGLPQVTASVGFLTVSSGTGMIKDPESANKSLRNYPNPFSHVTTIECKHPDFVMGTKVTLEVFNVNMARVMIRESYIRQNGNYYESWDGKDLQGNRLPDGMYIYVLTHRETKRFGRMMIIE